MNKLDERFKWLARDKDGELWAFESKPYKNNVQWLTPMNDFTDMYRVAEISSKYSFIKFEDDEPTKIKYIKEIIGRIDLPQEESEKNKTETVNKPSHYIGVNGMEVEEVLENFLPKIKDGYVAHRVGSAIEYLLRHPEKNGDEDILKAKQNIEQIIKYGKRKELEPMQLQYENEMNDYLKTIVKTHFADRLAQSNKIATYYGGTNLND